MPKNLLLGIGNALRSDDGAGSFIAQNFYNDSWDVIDGRTAPENYTSVIKKMKPELMIIIDSVEMGLPAGSIRLIPSDKIVSLQFSTHYMSLSYLIEYLSPYCKKILLIGIQPLSTEMGEELSEPVLGACYYIINLLKSNKIEKITSFS